MKVSTRGGGQPRWRRDGKELFYRTWDGKMMVVPVKTTAKSFEAGVPRMLFASTADPLYPNLGIPYDLTADGQRFLVNEVIDGNRARRRPTASSGNPSACAVSSAAARPQKRPWQRPMPQRVMALRRLTSAGPKFSRRSIARSVAGRDALAAADHHAVVERVDRADRPSEGAREAALKAPQARDAAAATGRDRCRRSRCLKSSSTRAGRKLAGERGGLRAADRRAVSRHIDAAAASAVRVGARQPLAEGRRRSEARRRRVRRVGFPA